MKRISFNLLFILILFASCNDNDNVCIPDQTITPETSNVTKLNDNHHRVYTDIVINVSASSLWSTLTNFDNMPNWSTSLQGLTGNISNGGEVEVTYILPHPVTGTPTQNKFTRNLIYTDGVQFGWSAPSTTFVGIVDNHIFKVEAISECQSRFIQTDEFQGTTPNVTTAMLANASLPLYKQFNSELKLEAEK